VYIANATVTNLDDSSYDQVLERKFV